MIYLDSNATSFLAPEIAERMHFLAQQPTANPSSQHALGRKARALVEQARFDCLQRLGANTKGMASDSLLFTSGGTEANNLAIAGMLDAKPGRLIVSTIEHPSVLAMAERLSAQGQVVDYLRVCSDGQVDLGHLEELLADATKSAPSLVSVMAANNETGVLQPMREISQLCKQHGVLLHCDAVQLTGKLPLHFGDLALDAMTFTAHKIHGPIGVGGLILKHGTQLTSQLYGGFQQQALRPGTESAILADALSETLKQCDAHPQAAQRMEQLRTRLEFALQSQIPDVVINGEKSPRLPHTTSVSFLGLDRQALQVALDLKGLACSTGSACASGSSQPSHVLQAMKVDERSLKGAIRLSLSRYTTDEEIDSAIDIIASVVAHLRKGGRTFFG